MERRILPRMGAACGVLYVGLTLAGNSVYGEGSETAGVLRQAEGENGWLSTTAFGAGLIGITIKFASIAPVLAMGKIQQGTALYRSMELVSGVSFNLSIFPFAVLATAVTIVTLKTRVLPARIGWIGAVTAPALLVNAMFFFAENIMAFLLFMLWIGLVSSVLTLRGRASVTSPAAPEPARVR